MKNWRLVRALILCPIPIAVTLAARPVQAQGPAGAGAAEVVRQSSRSYNPAHWIKRDSQNSADMPGARSDAEKKLAPVLQAEGVLPVNQTVTASCINFAALDGCLAALHAAHDLGLNFACVQASVTGVHTSADLSGCKDVDQDRPQSLKAAIHRLKPGANAKQFAKSAEEEARSDIAKIGS